ncbi:MAG: YqiA/YcfP family alpha/beta fold hydrolase [Bryobacteraceae bacterium]
MLPERLRVLYLHGFASSAGSQKAAFFSAKLRKLGFPVIIPDLDERNFERLTITAQLQLIERIVEREPIILIGSSLGGYLASLYASAHSEASKVILLAPAFKFYQLWADELGPERLSAWRKAGSMPIFHYGEGRMTPIGYGLMDDAASYPPFPDFHQPALIFHGNHDPVVPVTYSAAFVEAHPNARLVRLDSGHELTDVLDPVWEDSRDFLLSGASPFEC